MIEACSWKFLLIQNFAEFLSNLPWAAWCVSSSFIMTSSFSPRTEIFVVLIFAVADLSAKISMLAISMVSTMSCMYYIMYLAKQQLESYFKMGQ